MTNTRMHGIFGALLKENMRGMQKTQRSTIPVRSDEEIVEEEALSPVQLDKGQIAVDIFEEDGYFIIKAPIAGVKLADLDIDVVENVITIRGRREQTDVVRDEQYILRECYFGDFERKVTLPCAVNPGKVRATFSKDGILKVFIPKEESRKVKIVKINEGG
ncbi:MAG TPA: Hsp20/alpha crystallin family protein [Candidatus Peribacterales bacterium]|nr:Hsp20/alpha crystallin family protein [Candidatus Peribacterales bacterium]